MLTYIVSLLRKSNSLCSKLRQNTRDWYDWVVLYVRSAVYLAAALSQASGVSIAGKVSVVKSSTSTSSSLVVLCCFLALLRLTIVREPCSVTNTHSLNKRKYLRVVYKPECTIN